MAMKAKTIIKKHGAGESALADNLRFVWLLIGIGIIVIAAAVVLQSVASAIWAILAAALIVFILKTPVAWFESKGVPRSVSSVVLVLLLTLASNVCFTSFIIIIKISLIKLFKKGFCDCTTRSFHFFFF